MEFNSNCWFPIREARKKKKSIQYKILDWYYIPSRLYKISVGRNDYCWKCLIAKGTSCIPFGHVQWFLLCGTVLIYMQGWLCFNLPKSPKLCLLGDKRGSNVNHYRALNTALVTCSWLILKFWKNSHGPRFRMWKRMNNWKCGVRKDAGKTTLREWNHEGKNGKISAPTCLQCNVDSHLQIHTEPHRFRFISLFLFLCYEILKI